MEISVFNALVMELYGLCSRQESLPYFLSQLSKYYGCRSCGVHIVDRVNYHVVCEAVPDAGDDELQLYAAHFGRLKPYLENLRDIEKRAVVGQLYLFRNNQLLPMESASEVLHGDKNSPEVIDLLFRENGYIVHMVICCPLHAQPSYERLMDSSRLLLPHVQQAFKIYHTIEQLKNYSVGFEQAMHKLNSGILLFDGNAALVYQNRKARAILATTHVLSVISGKMVGPSSGATQDLARLIRSAVEQGKQGNQRASGMTLRMGDGRDPGMAVIAIALHPHIHSAFTEETGVYAAVMISTGGAGSGLEPDLLQLLYGLTPAEANLAIGLSDGSSMERYALQAGISLHTARGYLKLIFQKTYTSRQAELVALLRSIPVVIHNPD
ncbi:helix-turn-helix transcriptional regulator [Mariprofundus ferrooxydans]|uniref:helix-turn-helix transcriptional regulator n=1 Tax=Mariprofundus ferrooxydans TaxID=314344 RepID=UPI001E365E38|nr:helix-turn-helix transcriptional regulator [Mariprofundus ferrooxydans]